MAFATTELLRFLRRAKREHPFAFEGLDTHALDWNVASLKKMGVEQASGFLFEHTRDTLVARAVELVRYL
jgi:hypothetical protein